MSIEVPSKAIEPVASAVEPEPVGSDVQAIILWRMRHGAECLQLFARAEAAVVAWFNSEFTKPPFDESPVTTAEDAIESAGSYGHYVFVFTLEMEGNRRMFA
jgi:hypothetical protein